LNNHLIQLLFSLFSLVKNNVERKRKRENKRIMQVWERKLSKSCYKVVVQNHFSIWEMIFEQPFFTTFVTTFFLILTLCFYFIFLLLWFLCQYIIFFVNIDCHKSRHLNGYSNNTTLKHVTINIFVFLTMCWTSTPMPLILGV